MWCRVRHARRIQAHIRPALDQELYNVELLVILHQQNVNS
jgi:hypothetical protein